MMGIKWESRLSWFGRVRRRDWTYQREDAEVGAAGREEMKLVRVEDAVGRVGWRNAIGCGER